MEIEELFGLPAHPLVVHAAATLLPLAAVARARRASAPIDLGLARVATLAVGLAHGSGEALEGQVDQTELGEGGG